MNHYCHAIRCGVTVPPEYLFCREHWGMVPKEMQRAVYHGYRRGQEHTQTPSPYYVIAARRAIIAVAEQEHPELVDGLKRMLQRLIDSYTRREIAYE